ncbi:TrmH family RNA methyltransferase [Staphylospora marina]|uniref:TrmH family RNA methyltransferase n=1 Tax=Staphylospora marina TaxID=2490858 RepID=UPI000F5C0721|nr:RNA methyltransferase [Staphylospora marina]
MMHEPARISSPRNEHVKRWKKLHSRKGRERNGTFLAEGEHLVREALAANLGTVSVMVRKDKLPTWKSLAEEAAAKGARVYVLDEPLFDGIAETENPQGISAEVRFPVWDADLLISREGSGTYLLLDRIQDPGNLGTLLRTALAAGVSGVWLGKGTVDAFNAKVLRSAMGAVFRLPLVHEPLDVAMNKLKASGVTVVTTSPHAGRWHFDCDYPEKVAFLLGNEGQGVDPELAAKADVGVKIPMPGGTESLNVSVTGAVLLYERVRRMYAAQGG